MSQSLFSVGDHNRCPHCGSLDITSIDTGSIISPFNRFTEIGTSDEFVCRTCGRKWFVHALNWTQGALIEIAGVREEDQEEA